MMAILNKFRRQKPQQKPDLNLDRLAHKLEVAQQANRILAEQMDYQLQRIQRLEKRVAWAERVGQRVSKIERCLSRKRKGARK